MRRDELALRYFRAQMKIDPNMCCIFCGAKSSTLLFEASDVFGEHYQLNECNNCQSVFLSPFPSKEHMIRAYADDYYGDGDKKFTSFIETVLDWFRNKRAHRLNRILTGSGKVLDIGCGNGNFLNLLQSIGNYEIHGLEMPGKSADRAKLVNNINLKIGSLQSNDYEKSSFDAVTLYHVFEHLPNPQEYLNIIHSILKEDGTLVMSFPNISSWQWNRFKGDWFHLDPPRHLFFMPGNAFKKHMREFGFEIIGERHFSIEYNPYGYQQSLLNRWSNKREVLYEYLKGNKAYTREYSNTHISMQQLFVKATFPLFVFSDFIASLFKKSATVEYTLKKVNRR
jgi:SAM-dependent methyltransferase